MPIPTDTFWNIKRLNIVFAISAVALMGITMLSILQDYDKSWRGTQQSGRVWEAALTEQRIRRAMTLEQEEKLKDFQALAGKLDSSVKSGKVDYNALAEQTEAVKKKHEDRQKLELPEKQTLESIISVLRDPAKQKELDQYRGLTDQINDTNSKIETLTFTLNNLKSAKLVLESNLQDARTAGDRERISELEEKLKVPRQNVADWDEKVADWKKQLEEARKKRSEAVKPIDDLRKLVNKLGGDIDLMTKKYESLVPQGLLAKTSEHIRKTPLLQFINPADKVRQVVLPDVLTDVSFMKIETIDRCTTCHVHIEKKEFAEERVLSYLEEQLAAGRDVQIPAAQKVDDPSIYAPGALGMPEFWHVYAARLAPADVQKNIARINALAATVGKGVTVQVNGESAAVNEFKYDAATTGEMALRRDMIVGELLKAFARYEPGKSKDVIESRGPRVSVQIKPQIDGTLASAARDAALAHPPEIRRALQSRLDKKAFNLLEERYRHALVANVNYYREDKGYDPLDASPTLLAHPRLDLYADIDSPHSFEAVGCTACHDGSGQETNFVLAAHWPREIWVDAKNGVPVLPQQIVSSNGHGDHPHNDLSDMRETALEESTSLHFDHLAKGNSGHDDHATTRPSLIEKKESVGPRATADAAPVSYVDPLTGETRKAVPQAQYWKQKHELESGTSFKDVFHYWDWPMRAPEHIQANCARCHTDVHDIKEEAPVLFEGRTLFVKYGCASCHQMDSIPVETFQYGEENGEIVKNEKGEIMKRPVGPDLRHVNAKLSPAFLHSWIWSPKAFRPSTQMPHFFMLENNSSDEEIRRTQQEVRAITYYLMKTASPMPASKLVTDPVNKMPEIKDEESEDRIARGRALFIGLEGAREGIAEKQGGVGCIACHTNLNETGLHWITTDLIKNGVLAEEMAKKLGKPPTAAQLSAEARKRYDAMSYNERQLYAAEHFSEGRGATEARESVAMTPMPNQPLPRYADGTLKPVFQHHGPELSGVGTKLLTGRSKAELRKWLYEWLIDPRHYSAYTVMPRLRLTPDEATDLTEYLLAQQRNSKSPKDNWAAVEIAADQQKVNDLVTMFLRSQYPEHLAPGMAVNESEMTRRAAAALKNRQVDAKKAEELAGTMLLADKQLVFLGQKLIQHYQCMNCHGINGMEGAPSICPNLSDWGQKTVDKLDYGYASHHHVDEFNRSESSRTKAIPLVNALSVDAVTKVTKHSNNKNWSEPIAKDAHVSWPHIGHTRQEWLVAKLKNSRVYDRGKNLLEPMRQMKDGKPELENGNPIIRKDNPGKPYDKLRMPTFYFNDEQIHAISTFVLSNRDRLITPRLIAKTTHEDARRIARGRQIVEQYNCVGCHRVEGNEPAVQQYWLAELLVGNTKFTYYTKDDLSNKAPPSLRSQGARVQHAWVHHFLQNVEDEGTIQKENEKERRKIRPQPFIRMPSFPITDAETTAVAAYFNAISNKEARMHAKALEPLLADVRKELQAPGMETAAIEKSAIWPTEDWFTQERYSRVANYLKQWALDHTLAKPNDFAATQPPEAIARAYMLALFDARFVAMSFEAKYPFIDQYRVDHVSDERFKKGEQFYHLLQCQQCHVVGDERNPGVLQQPKGPNLSLSHRRIASTWSRYWIQEPQTIQPGNPMASIFFSGRGIPALTDPARSIYEIQGLPHLTSSPTPELVKQIQAQFGETPEEQIRLVMDFIWAAGMRNHTAIDPPAGQPINLPTVPPEAKLKPIPGITAPLPEPVKKAVPVAPPPPPPTQVVMANTGPSVIGRVVFEGTPPAAKGTKLSDPNCAKHHPNGVLPADDIVVGKDKGLRYTVVTVKNPPPGRFAPPADPAVLDQKGCRYEPHVLPMMTGQKVMVKNSDPLLHNVHGLPSTNPGFNFGQNGVDPGKPVPSMTASEQFRVKCDVHPWMNCFFVVYDHPFFAATGEDGSFRINGLPPGTYTITTWHEKLPPVEQEVTVSADKPAEVTLTLKASE